MGLINFLNSALEYLGQHGPEFVDKMQRAAEQQQEKLQRQQEELERQQIKIDKYKTKYSSMSNKELQERVDQGVFGAERAAIASIDQERRLERETCQEQYSTMSSIELMAEYKYVNREKRQGSIDRQKADLKLAILSRILKERGYHLDSDLEWSKL